MRAAPNARQDAEPDATGFGSRATAPVASNSFAQLTAEEIATLAEREKAKDAEVICIVRPLSDPHAKSEIIVLDKASPAFLKQLGTERTEEPAARLTSLAVPDPSAQALALGDSSNLGCEFTITGGRGSCRGGISTARQEPRPPIINRGNALVARRARQYRYHRFSDSCDNTPSPFSWEYLARLARLHDLKLHRSKLARRDSAVHRSVASGQRCELDRCFSAFCLLRFSTLRSATAWRGICTARGMFAWPMPRWLTGWIRSTPRSNSAPNRLRSRGQARLRVAS